MSKLPLDLKQFKKALSDKNTTTLRHRNGHEFKIVHSALSPEHRKLIDSLPTLESELPPTPVAKPPKKEVDAKSWGGEMPRQRYATKGLVEEEQDPTLPPDLSEEPLNPAPTIATEKITTVEKPVVVQGDERSGVSPHQFKVMSDLESNSQHFDKSGQPVTSSPANLSKEPAFGKHQMQIATARGAAERLGEKFDEAKFLSPRTGDPAKDKEIEDYHSRLAKSELDALNKKYEGDYGKAMAAYNWGQGNVDRAGADWRDKAPPETKEYVAKAEGRDAEEQYHNEFKAKQAEEAVAEPAAAEQTAAASGLPPEEKAERQKLFDDVYKASIDAASSPETAEALAFKAVEDRATKFQISQQMPQGLAQIGNSLASKEIAEKNKKREALGLDPLPMPANPAPAMANNGAVGTVVPGQAPAAAAPGATAPGVPANDPLLGIAATKIKQGALDQQAGAIKNTANLAAQQEAKNANIYAADQQMTAAKMAEEQKAMQNVSNLAQVWVDKYNKGEYPHVQLFSERSTPSKILGFIALALGGMGQGLMRAKSNPALDAIQQQIDNEIKKQDMFFKEGNTLYNALMQMTNNRKTAADMYRLFKNEWVASSIAKEAANTKNPMAIERGNQLIGELRENKIAPLAAEIGQAIMVAKGMAQPEGGGGGAANESASDWDKRSKIQEMSIDNLRNLSVNNPKNEVLKSRYESAVKRFVPGYPALAKRDLNEEAHKEFEGFNAFENQMKRYQQFLRTIPPQITKLDRATINQGAGLAKEAQIAYQKAMGVNHSDNANEGLKELFPSPTAWLKDFNASPKLIEVLEGVKNRRNALEKQFGLPSRQPLEYKKADINK